MKYITTILFVLFMANTAFSQTYKNAWEVPDAIQMGYKGKVKKITITTYGIKMHNGKAVQDTLERKLVDSFDTKGFLQYSKDLKHHTVTFFTYVNDKLENSTMYTNGVKTTYEVYTYKNTDKIIATAYEYDKTGNKISLPDRTTKTILNKLNKIDTVSICNDKNYCSAIANVYEDEATTKVYMDWVANGEFILWSTKRTLLSDDHSNPVEDVAEYVIGGLMYRTNYTYEYYE